MTTDKLLTVCGLSLEVAGSGHQVVKSVSFDLAPGEIFGIVGESGSGKTLATRSLISLLPPNITVTGGSVTYKGRDVLKLKEKELRRLRGAEIGVVFQEPMTSLNPSMTIGRQLEEGLVLHTKAPAQERRLRILDMLKRVGIRDPEGALASYPHEFSGGMRQRIMLASVMLLKPALLIADEPTTALDAVIQRDVMELMVELTRAEGTAVLLISHDLPMVARYTSRIVVMEKGAIVEQGRTEDLLTAPQHPYTRKLLSSLPFRGEPRRIDTSKAPMISAREIIVDYAGRKSLFRKNKPKRALHGVSIDIYEGEVVALVGGSGSGKTTLGRTIAGLVKEDEGRIQFQGRLRTENWADYRLNCQMVFQDPYSSLDPRMTIQALVEEALRLVPGLDGNAKRKRSLETLEEVGLGMEYAGRYPHELSGGQRQRVAIARAIARRPRFLIADEPVSALDVTVRAQVLDLFSDLQKRYGFSCLFISHDLGVVEQVADRVVVMQDGRIIEEGARDSIFDSPKEAYTRRLLSAIPALDQNENGGVTLKWRLEN
ncbi:ABC transporter ATP-binding protein [Sinorhizobium medicae]|uniref:ABC transporter ATP-binding protein n=1 Tax=Sinorhizobium medicae TaxID=110321 RepID=UPI000C7BD01D|nr:ABC transporter ATP-binding protein [Sinorhizobium medicae]MDX0515602.1 dipeptide ABC transporter ATP-binding protein [Sinorhizobium medicae]MDX0726427.1 dipeptide ABC transporter ATP-binding protein [Sinorhizobium medicae]MDX0732634.1 dipeptide ABC transporter ATP-binding protein [Sinorhizobium medicae]MDX0812362.1 dipeptide ABC transporter ATP-binding protein [Sinorhizobium medicae]MDX1099292.1 dipeptide ABC transporter ATP-binding protein [Sinorhizobium medicae]